MSTTYMAFRASDELFQRTDGFIRRMRCGACEPEPAVVQAIMTAFIHEALEAFFLKPATLSGLGKAQGKMVETASETISRAANLVIRRCVRRMDLEQNQAAAEYMDEIRIPAADRSFWYVAFPLSNTVAEQGHRLARLAEGTETDATIQAMVAYLHCITDEALIWYFHKPIELLQFGPVLRKVAAIGVGTTRRASHGVINRVIPRLNDRQLRQSAHYYEAMQITCS